MKSKKGISPVVATTMLIGLVIVLGIIIALWFANLTEESIVKFERNIDLVCLDVSFSVNSFSGGLELTNTGTVPIYDFNVIAEGPGYSETRKIRDIYEGLNANGLEQGSTVSLEENDKFPTGADELTIVPILMGNTNEGRKAYECDESTGKNVIF